MDKYAWNLWTTNVISNDYLKRGGYLWIFYMTRKYFSHGDFMQAKVLGEHSKIWNFICFCRVLLQE